MNIAAHFVEMVEMVYMSDILLQDYFNCLKICDRN